MIVECLIEREGNTEIFRNGQKYVFQRDVISGRAFCDIADDQYALGLIRRMPHQYRAPSSKDIDNVRSAFNRAVKEQTDAIAEDEDGLKSTRMIVDSDVDVDDTPDQSEAISGAPVNPSEFMHLTKRQLRYFVTKNKDRLETETPTNVIEQLKRFWEKHHDDPFPM